MNKREIIWTSIVCIIFIITIILASMAIMGCISSNSYVSGETLSEQRAKQQSDQSAKQESSASNNSTAEVITTTTEELDKEGKIITRTTTTTTSAKTGSETNQVSSEIQKMNQEMQQLLNNKFEGSSKASMNLTWILLGVGGFIILIVIILFIFELYRIKKGTF